MTFDEWWKANKDQPFRHKQSAQQLWDCAQAQRRPCFAPEVAKRGSDVSEQLPRIDTMKSEELANIFRRGGVVVYDPSHWLVTSAHEHLDVPERIGPEPDDRNSEAYYEWLEAHGEWVDSLDVCDSGDTSLGTLLRALCLAAGVRVIGLDEATVDSVVNI